MGFCRQARLRDPRLVIVSSLARQRDWLEQELFGCGVNDVVSDEFSASVVATRILVRLAERDKMGFGRHGVELGDTIINVVRREIIRGDRRISLTRRQAQLLAYLMNNSERIVSRTELVENIWENTIDPNGKNLDMYVAQLRKAIEPDPTNPIHLLTVWNTGYRFAISGPTGDGALQAANQATSQDGESSE